MQRINNAFDHLHSVADAAAISFFPSSRCPGFTSIISAREVDQRDGGEGEERLHEHKALLSLQSSLPFWWYRRPVSVGYLSSSGWHPHTLSFITNASTAKLYLRDKHAYLRVYLPNCAPIDSVEYISMATKAHKFSFAPPGQGYCCYHSTVD